MDTKDIKPAKSVNHTGFVQGEEIMSPEGVEEKIEMVMSFIVTLTQGSKYRLYGVSNPCGMNKCKKVHDAVSLGLRDTRKEMMTLLGLTCMQEGATMARAELIMGTLDDFLKRNGDL